MTSPHPASTSAAAAAGGTALGMAVPSASAATSNDGTRQAIQEIRAVLVEDPKLAEELARADQARSPHGPDADERDALLVAAVYNQSPLRARTEARKYFLQHPDGRYTDFLKKYTRASVPLPSPSSVLSP